MNYDHLGTNALNTRYVLAADYVKGVDAVLEIGGTDLWRFLPWKFHTNTLKNTLDCIDPVAGERPMATGVHFCNKTIQEFSLEEYVHKHRSRTKAAVLIGIEMEITRPDLLKLIEDLSSFDLIIMDHVMSNQTADLQASMMANAFLYRQFRLKTELMLAARYDHRYMTSKTEYTPSFFKNRLFQVFEKF